jgi:prevent-host-death family protein
MKKLPLTEVKRRLGALVDEVERADQTVVITKNGVPKAVLVSADEFESWRKAPSTRVDQENLAEIRQGLAALGEGRASLYTLKELFEE